MTELLEDMSSKISYIKLEWRIKNLKKKVSELFAGLIIALAKSQKQDKSQSDFIESES